MYQCKVGAQLCTAAAGQAVGVAGKPTRVYAIHLISGATAGIVTLKNGTVTGDAIFVQETAPTTSTGNDFNYGEYGILFPKGCFYQEVVDANVASTLVVFEQET